MFDFFLNLITQFLANNPLLDRGLIIFKFLIF